jgi:hypothetical protein
MLIRDFGGIFRERCHLDYKAVDGNVILRRIFKKCDGVNELD